MTRWFLLTALVAAFVGPAQASDRTPAQTKIVILEQSVKHCNDVLRFFSTHQHLLHTQRGRDIRWQHQRLRAWSVSKLAEHRTLIRRSAVVRRLARAVHGTPLQGSAPALERVAWRYGISPFFIVAVAATESSIGKKACPSNRRNVWGLSSCGAGWYVPYFRTWDHAYEFYAAFLKRQWPHARTTYDYAGYAACSACWGRKTAAWMRSLFGVGPDVGYA